MKVGTYYYPEQWPREQWERDFDRIAEMGLQIVHLAEFAWYALEPSPGDFRFDWLDHCLQLAADRSLDVILCTPTAAPPIWLSHRHPEILPQMHQYPVRHGGRRHYNPLQPAMRDATTRIVDAMAKHFGHHPSVIGWQIDNEVAIGHDLTEVSNAAFWKWLEKRYGTIAELNRAWGNQFWTQYYESFDQISLPVDHQPRYNNQSLNVDAARFWSDAGADFVELQCKLLRPHIGDRWLTTNFMTFFPGLDPAALRDSLSLFSWDAYPVSGFGSGFTDERFRLPDPSVLAFMHDQMAAQNGRWGLMEVQPGQINWSGVPVALMPGAVRLMLWSAYVHNAEFVTVYRLRKPRFHIEMWHDGLLEWDGVTPSRGGLEFSQTAAEMKQLASLRTTSNAQRSPANAAIVHEHAQFWQFASLPQAKRYKHAEVLHRWHGVAEELSLTPSVITSTDDFGTASIVIVAGQERIERSFVDRLQAFAERGGHVIIGPRTGWLDRDGQAWEGPPAMPVGALLGSRIAGYDALPDDTFGEIEFDGRRYKWSIWAEGVTPGDGVEVLGVFADQFYHGAAAIVRRSVGEGSVTFVGACDDAALCRDVLALVASRAAIVTSSLEPGTRLHRRDGLCTFLNFNPTGVTAPAPANAEFVIGTRDVPAAGVAVWRDVR